MDEWHTHPDWTLLQSFLAVSEHGSLSGAANALGRSQPTLGRHIQSLETTLDTRLFERHARGLRLTRAGAALIPLAEDMQAAAQRLSLVAAGQSERLSGSVRITASLFLSHYALPPIIARIRTAEPDIRIDLVPSDESENLLFRAADIAVRMYRPTQLEIVTRHLRDIEIAVFAAKSYLERAGRPTCVDDLFAHDLIGFDSNDLILRTVHAMGYTLTRDDFAVRCDNQATYWALVQAGCGVGFSQSHMADDDPLVERLPLSLGVDPMPVWLAAHPSMRQTPRVRRIWDLLAEYLLEAEL